MVKRMAIQGVWNIIRFNWHYYAFVIGLEIFMLAISLALPQAYRWIIFFACAMLLIPLLISLLVSYYVYDYSDLYSFKWLENHLPEKKDLVININAGFDETSGLIEELLKPLELIVYDFYNPDIHTEISIKRARTAGLIYKNTIHINTEDIPQADFTADLIILFLSAHEIRDETERVHFFSLLKRKCRGRIIVVEHLRDFNNFLAYSIGFLHFHSLKTWHTTFNQSGLDVIVSKKINPFISIFVLE